MTIFVRAIAPGSARAFGTTSPRTLARIAIIGNMSDTPEVHATNAGREILRYAVASNYGPRENRKTSWFKVTSFAEGSSRDFLMNLAKGTRVYIEGNVSINSYTDSNGIQRSQLSIVQRLIDVIKRPESAESPENVAESLEQL